MSLVFSQTSSPYKGVIQRCEVMVYGPDGLGRISGNATQLGLWTTRANNAMDKIHERILQASGYKRQFDDPNHTGDYNTIYANLVSGQSDYVFTTDEGGNLILDLYRVYAKTTGGNYEPLTLVDELSDYDFYSESSATGHPTKYAKKTDGAIFVKPTPSTTVTNGLKFEISREGDYFTTSDTTQKPGFRGTLHDLLPTYMVLEYAEENTISNVNLLERRAQKLEQALDLAYGKVAPDERNIISPKRILYK